VPGLHIFHADQRDDVASLGGFDLFPVVGVHFNDPADPLGFAGGGIQNGFALAGYRSKSG
jgi:hypothetical protein